MGGVLAAAAGGDDLPINDVGAAKSTAADVAFKEQFKKEVAIASSVTDGKLIFFPPFLLCVFFCLLSILFKTLIVSFLPWIAENIDFCVCQK